MDCIDFLCRESVPADKIVGANATKKALLDSCHHICQRSPSQSKQTNCLFKLVCTKYKERHTYEVKYLHRYFICVKYLFVCYVVKFMFIGFKIATLKKSLVFRVLETLLG